MCRHVIGYKLCKVIVIFFTCFKNNWLERKGGRQHKQRDFLLENRE